MATCVISSICIKFKMSGEIVAKTMDFVFFFYVVKPVLTKLYPLELEDGEFFLIKTTVKIYNIC